MSEQVTKFDYYYGLESEQFRFIRIPKMLVEDTLFQELSDRAKILYGIMLDRMNLSRENSWLDEENRVFIIFSIDEICKAMNCSKPTACKAIAELDTVKGIGLIERRKRGQGLPDIIYVKNFITCTSSNYDEINAENTDECSEVKNLYFKKLNNFTPKSKDSLPTEVKEVYPNNTNTNNTESNNNPIRSEASEEIDECSAYMELIRDNISYDELMSYFDKSERDIFDELYNLICEIVCVNRKTVRINGEDYPYQLVKKQYLRLKKEHLEYVAECMRNNRGHVGNMRAYLITTLYNAPNTIEHNMSQSIREMKKSGWN